MRRLALYIIAILSTLACERRELEESFDDTAKIPVSIDWSLTDLDPTTDTENLYRASVYLFANSGTPFDGASYKEYKLSNATYDEISVPMGEYSVVIFNNSTSEFSSNVDFRGKESYNDFEYYAKDDETRTQTTDESYKLEPDILAAWRTESFTVTSDMVLLSRGVSSTQSTYDATKAEGDLTQLTEVQPERLSQSVIVRVYATNINSAASAAGKMIGMSHSVKMASGSSSEEGASQSFAFESRVYDEGSTKNGYVEATFESLGMIDQVDGEYYVEVRFTLTEEYDYSLYYPALTESAYRFNVTDQVEAQADELTILILLGFDGAEGDGDGDGDDDNDNIELPQLNISGGFLPNIGAWGDEIPVEI